MISSHVRRLLAATTGAAAAASLALIGAPTAQADGNVVIPHTKPTWLSHATRHKSRPAGSAKQTVRVYLAPRGGQRALDAEVAALSDPGSPRYGKWLTAEQYAARYEPTAAGVARVRKYLTDAGLTTREVEAQHRYVAVTGTVKQLNKAFGVSLAGYTHDGENVVAPATNVSMPADVAAAVLTVTGLDTTRRPKTHSVTPPDAFVNAKPCSLYFGQVKATYQGDYETRLPQFNGKTLSYAPCGYTGPQFRAAYEGKTSLTGKGVTVAITDAYDWQFIAKDASTYAANHGDAAYAPGQLVRVPAASYNRQKECDAPGWTGEETLDVEAVHAMAAKANIRYYASASCFDEDFLTTLAKVVDENKAQLVTNSWGDTDQNTSAGTVAAYEQIFKQAATQGISVLFSSGDNGDELANTGIKQTDYPASDPYITGVGGTSTGIGADGSLKFQTGWGTDKYTLSDDGKSWTPNGFLYGAGGGYSSLFNRPTYQNGVVPSGPSGRAVPDIALDGDPNTGMLIGQTQTFPDGVKYGEYRIGGTSLASPLSAGFLALREQKVGRLGFLNPALYSHPSWTVDVTHAGPQGVVRPDFVNTLDSSEGIVYSVRTFDDDSSLKTTKGWDPVTGLGILSPTLLK